MNYTQNLNLPQWEKTDRIMMDDFNDAFGKLDAACGEMPRIAFGTYAPNGGTQSISLGFQPKAVLIVMNGTNFNEGAGFFTQTHPLKSRNYPELTQAEITSDGFDVYYNYDTRSAQIAYPYTNYGNSSNYYLYIALA